jgi:acylphosphatase
MPAARFIVSGRVQGVFYRASTREQALRLDLSGYAKNRADSCVEVVACGLAESLNLFERWLQQGPPAARVDAVNREELPEQDLHGFRIH